MSTADETIATRQPQHGPFEATALLAQALKRELFDRFHDDQIELDSKQREALEMICTKMARIVCGNPNHADHWHDIAGYARLIEIELESRR